MIRNLLLVALLVGIPFLSPAQQKKKYTISGYVKEQANGEAIIGAPVTIREPIMGTVTNTYGFFSITADSGSYELSVKYLGLEDFTQHIDLNKDISLDVKMLPKKNNEVVITDHQADANVTDGQMSANRLEMKQVNKFPLFSARWMF